MGSRGRRRAAARRNTNALVIGGVAAAAVIGVGVGAYALMGGSDSGSASGTGSAGSSSASDDKPKVKQGPPSATEVRAAAERFLTAWQSGDTAKAAALTDDPSTARAALTGLVKDAHLTDVKLTPGTGKGARVPFHVTSTVAYEEKNGQSDGQSNAAGGGKAGGKLTAPFAYDSSLTAVRRKSDGKVLVGWKASVVYPGLRDGDRLVTGEAGTPPIKALDRAGGELTTAKYPSIGSVLDGLREKYGKTAGGTAGVELRIVRKESKDKNALPDKTLLTLSKGTPGTVHTTLSPRLEAAAEKEVAQQKRAAVVVIRPSTGEILAVANSTPGFNVAFQGSLAPGSTMKIITSSMLLEKNLADVDRKHPCPKYFTYGHWKFHNDNKFEIKNGTFKASFAASCNTAFISQAPKLRNDSLTKQAQQVFGLGLNNWAIGVPSFDGSVPVQSQAQMAASLIGQGGVRMNPLNMASVAATVKNGTFHQPYLVSPDVDHRTLATASRTMSASTVAKLRELMHYTAIAGTAVQPMYGLGSDMGAKTGSAEVDGQEKPNGWFTAYRGDLASAAVVQAGGHGNSSAGPIVRQMLLTGAG
ncbi:penicillin-binding transpeptidase domain-containing protein [Streptomyces beihaiensis]|uniref:Penicillin-binding transpeptidase domain-containing protein n=1 Tax=Streptomyces beihaiensis TaxID=2984495 RepID=A0ABT3TUA8_9ACTN|nr:penicillin-binding transpeptidase domain-containing protein [Streptomyces beihaiensis]MCX3060622.1 penicillin-binding transpeptidase domain-containing protein [Streptomyces beihaiensis]